ncbi:MAG: glycoside hydrolase family 3 protein [Acidimicrobiia bacterium]|nr:glycoside hydrolase family 3 protein [Acidimicrobiia bacterium]
MNKKVCIAAVTTVTVAVLLAACSSDDVRSEDALVGTDGNTVPSSVSTISVLETTEPEIDPAVRINEILATMTTEQKVGQLLMPVLAGTEARSVSSADAQLNRQIAGLDSPAEIVANFNLGGVLYLETNVESAEQLRALSEDLQAAADSSSGLGLLVAVDQEGGRVNRITDQVTVYPSASDFGGDVEYATEAGFVTGQQLQRQGVNVVLAPVADVVLAGRPGFIGDRSYGDDPFKVADMVRGSITGLQQAGVAAAVKHWPGHGATSTDSHLRLPELQVDRGLWDGRERIPFDAAIENDVAIVVVGHLAVPGLDSSGAPATFSKVIIDDLLRQEMGFDGVVMTDALNMGAVGQYDEGALAVDAILAGADILLVPPDLASAYNSLLAAVENQQLSAERLDQSVGRILRLKQDLGLLEPTS